MPKFNWGISSDVVDGYDRSQQQFVPYSGPIPPNGVYAFYVKRLKFVAADRRAKKNASLRIGLELRARTEDEKKYAGYFVMAFRAISNNNAFTYVPFLDAIGVSGTDFTNRTIGDDDGNIQKIGRWKMDGSQVILAQLIDREDQNGTVRKDIGWMGPLVETVDEDDEDEEFDDEHEEDYEVEDFDDEDEDEEPEPPKRRKPATKVTTRKPATATRKRRRDADDEVPF